MEHRFTSSTSNTGKGRDFFVQLIFPGLKEIINLLKLQPNDEEWEAWPPELVITEWLGTDTDPRLRPYKLSMRFTVFFISSNSVTSAQYWTEMQLLNPWWVFQPMKPHYPPRTGFYFDLLEQFPSWHLCLCRDRANIALVFLAGWFFPPNLVSIFNPTFSSSSIMDFVFVLNVCSFLACHNLLAHLMLLNGAEINHSFVIQNALWLELK